MPQYHFTPNFTPYARASAAPHAAQYHAPVAPHMPQALINHPQRASQAAAYLPQQPLHHDPLNRYKADATIKTIADGHIVDTHSQLKPGEVVEVTTPGHQTELAYITYDNKLRKFDTSTVNRVPNEIRDHIKKVGGPTYFARELHNRLPTQGLYNQFKQSDFRGPNKPLL